MSTHASNTPRSADAAGSSERFSPSRFLTITLGGIFLAEVIAMIFVYSYQHLPYYQQVLIDATVMTVIITPILFLMSFRPLIRHIEKRQRAEEALRQVNRALLVLNECNQALVHAEEETAFLQHMCEIIVNTGEYRMAWIGFAEQDQAKSIRPAAQFGFENGYLDLAQITWADDERGRGPTGTAIRQGVVQVNQNFLTNPHMAPWRESALKRGYQSSIALPLLDESSTFGALTIYSTLPEAFNEEELHLLKELANDLAFGITALRVRAERNQAEKLNRQLSRIVEQTEDTVVVTNYDGIIEYVNPAFERLTGYTRQETLGNTPGILKSGIHDNHFYQELWNTVLKGKVFQSEIANRKKNGELFYEVKTITPLRDPHGNITHFVATGKDITEHKQHEEDLLRAYDELELRVQDRTQELRITNAELEAEIIERQQVEEALRASEQRLNRSQEIAHLGSWELDLVDDRLTWSDEVYKIFGLQPQEFAASYEAFLEAVHPDDRAAVDEAYLSSVQDGKDGYEIEHRVIRRSSGVIRFVHEKCEHFTNEDGQVIRSVGMVHDITERKEAEAQLRYQAALLSNVNDAIVASDAQFRITAWNSAAESLYGWKADEVIGNNGLEVMRTEWQEKDPHEMRRAIAETGHWRGEATQVHKDGARFPVEVSSIVLHDDNGQITGYISVNRDITERKRAEQKLRESEEKYRLISDNANDWIYWIKPDNSFQYISPSCERVTGFAPMDFINDPRLFTNIIHPEDRERVEAHLGDVWEGGETHNFDYRILTKTNEVRWISHSCDPVYTPDGKYIGRNGTNRDITERKRAEAALRQSEENFSKAFKSSPAALLISRLADGRFMEVNESYSAIVGYERNELLGQLTTDFNIYLNPTDRQAIVERLQTNGSLHNFETSIRHRSGAIRHVVAALELITFNGEACILTHLLDITERKLAEEALRASEAKYRNLFENMTEEVHFWQLVRDESGHIKTWRLVDANPPTLRSWERKTVEEIKGKTTDEIFGPGATEHYLPVVEKVMTEGLPYSYEDYFAHLDKYFRFTTVPLVDHFITTGADITNIKKAEEALRAARDELELRVQERTKELAVANQELLKEVAEREEIERQLRIQTTAMEAAADGILITDRQGKIQWTNPALAQISGYSTDDLIGHTTKIFNSGQHDTTYYQQMWDTILSGEVWRGEMTNRRRDGSLYVEEQTITPVRDNDSEITQFIAIKQDITARKQAEKEIRERDQKEKILTQTIHTMQLDIARDLHDTIGQNISFLRMKLDYLAEKKTRKKTELQVELRSMARAANESYDLMRGTLAVLQSENSTDLFRLFTRYAEQIKERSSFEIDFSSQGEPKFMSAKRMRQLFYIFREILNNIEKHANASQVSMAMTWARDALNLVIFDNGSGFDMDRIQYGSHYGLKFMRERAELLNGSLIIRSEVGSGTKIILEVPYE